MRIKSWIEFFPQKHENNNQKTKKSFINEIDDGDVNKRLSTRRKNEVLQFDW